MRRPRTPTRLGQAVDRAVRRTRLVTIETEIVGTLREYGGNVTRTARDLGVERSYLYKLIRRSPALRSALGRIRIGGKEN